MTRAQRPPVLLGFILPAALLTALTRDGSAGEVSQGSLANGSLGNTGGFNGNLANGNLANGGLANGASLEGLALTGFSLHGTSLEGTVTRDGVEERRTPFVFQRGGEVVCGTLAGTEMLGVRADGSQVALRIDAVLPDTSTTLFADPAYRSNSDVVLYRMSFRDDAGAFQPVCGGDGMATLLEGTWDATGAYTPSTSLFTIACTRGAIAKCVRFGYKPWRTATDARGQAVPLRDLHQACVRAVIADYCGDGSTHTIDGTLIDLWDRHGFVPRVDESQVDPAFSAEASFGSGGAGCLERARHVGLPASCAAGSGPVVYENSRPDAAVADPDDRVRCVREQEAAGVEQLVFTESGTYCPHPPSVEGARLARDCSDCTRKVCAPLRFRHCCGMDDESTLAWNRPCVQRAQRLCRE